ncbi:hypothetical protein BDZ91DRAFT_790039 [Kalaharituber pfeilii]|nr:hypothetical protein BDZ91DRAFT_790039 [Kalaharituber pfeilii]
MPATNTFLIFISGTTRRHCHHVTSSRPLSLLTILFAASLPWLVISQSLDTETFKLRPGTLNSTVLDQLYSDNALARTTLAKILRSANSNTADVDSSLAQQKGYRSGFAIPDEASEWYTSGITHTLDAYDSEGDAVAAGVRNVLAISAHNEEMGVRVTFVVNGTSEERSSKKYVHVLLVEPQSSNNVATFKAVKVEWQDDDDTLKKALAGIVWRGNLLYLTDNEKGLRVFDLGRIYEVRVGSSSKGTGIGKNKDGIYEAYGHSYVMFQTMNYTPDYPTKTTLNMCFASFDRSNSSYRGLFVGEYDAREDTFAKVLRYPFDKSNSLLLVSGKDSSARAVPDFAWKITIKRIVGGAFGGGKYYFTRLNVIDEGFTTSSDIWQWDPDVINKQGRDALRWDDGLPPGLRNVAWKEGTGELWIAGGAAEGGTGGGFVMAIDRDTVAAEVLPQGITKPPSPTQTSAPTPTTSEPTTSGERTTTPYHDSGTQDDEEGLPVKSSDRSSERKRNTIAIVFGSIIGAGLLIVAVAAFLRIKVDKWKKRHPPHENTSRSLSLQRLSGYSKAKDAGIYPHSPESGAAYQAGLGNLPSFKAELESPISPQNARYEIDGTMIMPMGVRIT